MPYKYCNENSLLRSLSQKGFDVNRSILSLLAVLACISPGFASLTAADGPVSPFEIEIPAVHSVPSELDVPRKINVEGRADPGTAGVNAEHWGKRKSLYYGGLELNKMKDEFIYIDPLDKDKTAGKEHYELICHGDVLTEILYHDKEGKLKVDENHDAAIMRRRYDRKGNLVEESSYNTDGTLKNDWYGFAIYRWEYDDNHRRVSGAFYDPSGELTHKKFSEVAVNRWAFDDKGNQILWLNYDIHGNLAKDLLGAAARAFQYDENGQKTLEMSYGPDLKPVNGKYGYAGTLRKYDEEGHIIQVSYYGPDLEPVKVNGFSVERSIYDSDGNRKEISFYDAEGNLTRNNEGVAIIMNFYDEKGERVRQKAYDEKKQMVDELILDPDTERWRRISRENQLKQEEE